MRSPPAVANRPRSRGWSAALTALLPKRRPPNPGRRWELVGKPRWVDHIAPVPSAGDAPSLTVIDESPARPPASTGRRVLPEVYALCAGAQEAAFFRRRSS